MHMNIPKFYPAGQEDKSGEQSIRQYLADHSSWRVALQEPWDPSEAETWNRPTFITIGNASEFGLPYGEPDPDQTANSQRRTKHAQLLGVLTVTILGCHHLPKMDNLTKDGQGADPYVVCGLGGYIGRTTVHEGDI